MKERVNLGIWNRLTQVVVALVVIAVLILIGMTYLPLIHQNERMRREIIKLDAQLRQQAALTRQLQSQINAISNDPATVARLVRERLGYAKPGETIIHFETNSSGTKLR